MTPTSENIRGTSALPYHLLWGRDRSISVEIYSFNNNGISDEKIRQVESELNVMIKKVPLPRWFLFVFRYHLLFVRLFLKYPIHHYVKMPPKYVDEIKAKKPDLIWVYGAEWSRVTRQFDEFRRIHTLPDSEALYYYRMLGQRFVTHDRKQFWRCAYMYPKFLALEHNYSTDPSIHYHLVGEEDANFLRKMNPDIKAHFIRHPHYEVADQFTINFHQPKIKLLIAGQYNYYMKEEADLLCEALKENSEELVTHYMMTFLGKGWEKHVETLRRAGWEVNHITFAQDYIKEICQHDIQLTPIAIGTGTKGKVLDALANGLLVIGTSYAMENIAVTHGESCIAYKSAEEVTGWLQKIKDYPTDYEKMAEKGRDAVLTHHHRQSVSAELFGLIR